MSAFTRGPFKIKFNPKGENYWLMPADKRSLAVATVWAKGYGEVVGLANARLFAQAYRLPDLANRVLALKSREDMEALKAVADAILKDLEPAEQSE